MNNISKNNFPISSFLGLFDYAKDIAKNHPTLIKTIQISSLLFGGGAFLFLSSLLDDNGFISSVAMGGTILAFGSLMQRVFSKEALPLLENTTDLSLLWERLNTQTKTALAERFKENPGIFLNNSEIYYKTKIYCLRENAYCINGQYLHANWIQFQGYPYRFIATQAPPKESMPVFWEAVFQSGSHPIIIDLTRKEEETRTHKSPISPYYPTKEANECKHGSISIKFVTNEENFLDTCVYQITHKDNTKEVTRYRFSNWQDASAITIEELKQLIETLETKLGPSSPDPIWVHCWLGIGRTGTLITAFMLKEKIKRKEITKENVKESLCKLIRELRLQRAAFVQTKTQFELLYTYAESLIKEMKG